ncbi:hypothetical protein ABZP36_030964 [Zizania latifolia]
MLPAWAMLLIVTAQNFLGYGWLWLIVTRQAPALPLWMIKISEWRWQRSGKFGTKIWSACWGIAVRELAEPKAMAYKMTGGFRRALCDADNFLNSDSGNKNNYDCARMFIRDNFEYDVVNCSFLFVLYPKVQIRGMHIIIWDAATTTHDFTFYADRLMEGLNELLARSMAMVKRVHREENGTPHVQVPSSNNWFGTKSEKKMQVPLTAVTSVIDGLKRLYTAKLKPLEVAYRFNDFASPLLLTDIGLHFIGPTFCISCQVCSTSMPIWSTYAENHVVAMAHCPYPAVPAHRPHPTAVEQSRPCVLLYALKKSFLDSLAALKKPALALLLAGALLVAGGPNYSMLVASRGRVGGSAFTSPSYGYTAPVPRGGYFVVPFYSPRRSCLLA